MPPKMMKRKAVNKMVKKRIAGAIEEYERTRVDLGNASGSGEANTGVSVTVQGCTHKDFMNGKPYPFNGTEGVVGLRRWIEKVEQWNGNVHTLGLVNANRIPWTKFKLMMTTKYSPATEIQRMEEELWTLTLKGDDIEAYNNRFHELALMYPDLVPSEKKKIERYMKGFPEIIKGNITSTRPTTLHEAVNLARELVEQAVQGKAARANENNKRSWEEHQRNHPSNNNNNPNNRNRNNNNNQYHQQNRRQETARAYAVPPAEGKTYAGTLPKCNRCNLHHIGRFPPKCRSGEKGHLRHLCSKGRNQRNEGARARAYVVVENPQQNLNVVTGTFLLNDHYASVLFDSGAERSFVSIEFTPFINISSVALNTSYDVELADGKIVVSEILEIHGERPEKDPKSLSCIKANKVRLDDIRTICDFPKVFPDDLTGLPPVHEIEFRIDLIPGALRVVKSPYRLAPFEMQELSNQLKELQEKGFIRPSHSPWGAPQRRWVELLSEYEYEIKYHPSKANVVADALSRKERLKPRRVCAMSMTIQSGLKAKILEAQGEASKDLKAPTEWLMGLERHFEKRDDGGVYFFDRVWIPSVGGIRKLIMDEAHTSRYSVHPGTDKMYYDLRDLYWWPSIKRDIAEYVSKCLTSGHDTIWVVVDRLTKSAHFLPIREDYKTEKLARIYINEIVARHGVPVSIILDPYHPETDGQSKHTIQTLKDMLRACVMDFGGSWDTHLPLVEFSYNNSYHKSIKCAPFEALYGRKCRSPVMWTEIRESQTLEDMLRACVMDFGGSWDTHLPLVKFSYNNSYHKSIKCAPFEALYGRKCRSPVIWTEIGESQVIGSEIVQETTEKIFQIKERLKTARSHQKIYADKRRKPLEFKVGDRVELDLTSDEDPIDEDGDTGVGDSEVLVSLGEISLGGKKSRESNIGDTKDGGKAVISYGVVGFIAKSFNLGTKVVMEEGARYFNVIGSDPEGRLGEAPSLELHEHGRILGACFDAAHGITDGLKGYAQHEYGNKALEVFEEMQKVNLVMDDITFIGVINVCINVGLVDEVEQDYWK
nr:putative reverse transcriptase domain-containing protein [Tanacetum cinerariifolium]